MNYLFGAPRNAIHIVPNGVEEIFLNTPAGRARPMAGLHRHHHGTQARFGTGAKAAVHCEDAGLDHRPGLRRHRSLRAKVFRAGRSGIRQLLRYEGADFRPAQAGANLPRGARLCPVKRHGKFEPVRAGGRRVRMPAALGRLAVGAQHVWSCGNYCPVTNSPGRRRPRCGNFTTPRRRLPLPPKPPTWNEIGRRLKAIYEQVLNSHPETETTEGHG